MARAVGIGGVFLKAKDPKQLAAWYAKHLGIAASEDGSLIFDGPGSAGMTVFAHFPADTKYFGEGPQDAMVNFRVDNLDELLTQLAAEKVAIDPSRMDFSYGRFAWITDPEGHRVELWEAPTASASQKEETRQQ
ncbi:MAG: VOC family protein [Terracidiphilus sp.]